MTDSPFASLAPNLIPNPPAEIPEAPGAGDAMERLSPFKEAQDVNSIIKNLTLDRPLALYIPDREKYKDHQFRIINDTSTEMAAALRKGWRPVDNPALKSLFDDKVSGTDKTGKITRPVLMSRENAIGEEIAKRNRQTLHDLYQGMDPSNKQFNSKYADTVGPVSRGETKGKFEGQGWKIKV